MAGSTSLTYQDQALREDLLDLLTNLSPTETQLVTGLGTSTAKSIRHEWLVEDLPAIGDNAQLEGSAITYHNTTDPERLYNYTQIFKRGYRVSGTQQAVDHAGYEDRYNHERLKALTVLKSEIEYALMRGSLVSGQTNIARRTRGVKASLSLITAQSGVSLTENMLNDYLQLVWDNTSTMVNAIYTDMYMKRKISGFTAGVTKYTDATDRRLINAIDVYESDAAKVVKLFPHRYVSIKGTDVNHGIVGINEDMFKIAWLRKPFVKEVDDGGDYEGGNIIAECCLENLHYNAGFWADQHL
jgi:hypothetical protein